MPNGRVTPELLILLARMIAYREHKGVDACRKHGLGAARQIVGDPLPANLAAFPGVMAYGEAQRDAALFLAAECQRCRGCKLGRAKLTAESPPEATDQGGVAVG